MSVLCLTTTCKICFSIDSTTRINKEKLHSSSVSDVITDLSDLPTKFGDEGDANKQDVIKVNTPTGFDSPPSPHSNANPKKMDNNHSHHHGTFDQFNFDSEEEHYDDDDDDGGDGDDGDFLLSQHFPEKDDSDDSEYKATDYGDESELGPTLDNFDAKLDGNSNELPIFLSEPQSTYVIRSRAAILKCKAAHALKVWCSFY